MLSTHRLWEDSLVTEEPWWKQVGDPTSAGRKSEIRTVFEKYQWSGYKIPLQSLPYLTTTSFSSSWSFLLENLLPLSLGPYSLGRGCGHCCWYPGCSSSYVFTATDSTRLFNYGITTASFLTGIPTPGLPLSSVPMTVRWEFSKSEVCPPESLPTGWCITLPQ